MAAPNREDYSGHSDRELLVEVAMSSAATAATVEAIEKRLDRDDAVTKEHATRLIRVEERLNRLRWLGRAAGVATLGALGDIVRALVQNWRR